MSQRESKNKLSIYLIKEEFADNHESIVKNISELEEEDITDVGTLYYSNSFIKEPTWLNKFLGDTFNNRDSENQLKIYSSSAKAILLTSVENRTFALSFGFGYTLLLPDVVEERFGLKIALSLLKKEGLQSIHKKNMSVIPKLAIEQIAKKGNIDDFGIDLEQDLVQGITGVSEDDTFGNIVTGKDSLSVTIPVKIDKVAEFLQSSLELYVSEKYKENFEWIDNIVDIKQPAKITALNSKMIEHIIEKEFNKVWLAIPEIIEWENVKKFVCEGEELGDDVEIQKYLSYFSDDDIENLICDKLKSDKIICLSEDEENEIYKWKVYNCIYCEVNEGNDTYILSNGKWYKIESDFAQKVHLEYQSIISNSIVLDLPECEANEREDKYNLRVEEGEESICNMDQKNIQIGGRYQKIEFCDLYSKDRKIIHVKKYGSSSVLSHLFAQGLVSGELFIADQSYREKINEKLPDGYKIPDVTEKPIPQEYKIIFAVISKHEEQLEIPFFSKVNIRNAKRRLENFGYSVSLVKIQQKSD